MRLLNGAELAGFIKERQAKQVRGLRQAHQIFPKLAIINCGNNAASKKYIELKKAYGADILVEVADFTVGQTEALELINKLNADTNVHGIILQLPLPQPEQTDELVAALAPQKDVDNLSGTAPYDAATPLAINWLLTGYNIELSGKNIVLVGQGRLVGAPLKKMFESSGLSPKIVDEHTQNTAEVFASADIIISAVGKAGVLTSDMLPPNCVVIDAGVTSEDGVLKGDVANDVYQRDDLSITPKIGGVGPLTIAALFDNLIRAASIDK